MNDQVDRIIMVTTLVFIHVVPGSVSGSGNL
jgi:hypothetical protein